MGRGAKLLVQGGVYGTPPWTRSKERKEMVVAEPPAHLIRLQDRALTGALQMAPRPGPENAIAEVLEVCRQVPLEGGIETAFERKKAKYSELAAEGREAGWKATSGGWMPRVSGVVTNTPLEGCRSDQGEAKEGNKGPGRGGWERELLPLAEEER
ncbi:unnamed protein product [Boreogadus saida]